MVMTVPTATTVQAASAQAIPKAAVTQTDAAVVRPWTFCSRASCRITPAPMKPMPVSAPWMMPCSTRFRASGWAARSPKLIVPMAPVYEGPYQDAVRRSLHRVVHAIQLNSGSACFTRFMPAHGSVFNRLSRRIALRTVYWLALLRRPSSDQATGIATGAFARARVE